MFTGLVECTGEVRAVARAPGGNGRLVLEAARIAREAQVGESIAANGCCLTVASCTGNLITFELLAETFSRTNLGDLHPRSPVNLERALVVTARLGGHFVQGHVDCASEIVGFGTAGADFRLEVALPPALARYVVVKGSIAVDGISLTVAEVHRSSFVVWIIPHTRAVTNLAERRPGERVNLEFDLLAKYVERLLQKGVQS